MKKTHALLLLIAVTMSGCFVDRYHDRGRGEGGGYERDRDHGSQERNRDNHDEHHDGDRGRDH